MRAVTVLISLLGVLSAPACFASLDASELTCVETQLLIEMREIVELQLSYGEREYFVADSSQCAPGESMIAAYVPTYDNAYCHVGGICRHTDKRIAATIYSEASYGVESSDPLASEEDLTPSRPYRSLP